MHRIGEGASLQFIHRASVQVADCYWLTLKLCARLPCRRIVGMFMQIVMIARVVTAGTAQHSRI